MSDTSQGSGGGQRLAVKPRLLRVAAAVADPRRAYVAALFGALVIFGFFGFAFLGAQSGTPRTICAAFYPLTIAFAIGTGMAGAFLGGGMAIRASKTTQRSGLALTATGGFLGVFLMLLASTWSHRAYCPGPELPDLMALRVASMPPGYSIGTLPRGIWLEGSADTLSVRFNPDPTSQNIQTLNLSLPSDNTSRPCKVQLQEKTPIDRTAGIYVTRTDLNAKVLRFNTDYIAAGDDVRQLATECFLYETKQGRWEPVKNEVLSDGQGVLLYVHRTPANEPPSNGPCPAFLLFCSNSGYQTEGAVVVTPIRRSVAAAIATLFVTAAAAAEAPLSTDQLLSNLASADEGVRTKATSALKDAFPGNAGALFAALTSPTRESATKRGALEILNTSIGEQQRELQVGKIRDLRQRPSGFRDAADFESIVRLTEASDATVRLAARSLIQKYPVDGFRAAFNTVRPGIFAATTNCDTTFTEKYIRYAALGLSYNRIVDKSYTSEEFITIDQAKDIDASFSDGQAAASCLPSDLRVDRAMLFYARSVVAANTSFNKSAGKGAVGRDAIAFADEFFKILDASADRYAFPQHAMQMMLFNGDATWEGVNDGTKRIRPASVSLASGFESWASALRQTEPLLQPNAKIPRSISPGAPAFDSSSAVKDILGVFGTVDDWAFVKVAVARPGLRGFGWTKIGRIVEGAIDCSAKAPSSLTNDCAITLEARNSDVLIFEIVGKWCPDIADGPLRGPNPRIVNRSRIEAIGNCNVVASPGFRALTRSPLTTR